MLSSINEMIPAGLFPWIKIRLDVRMEPKKLEWSFFVRSCLAAIAMNEILRVSCTRDSWYAGQCEGETWSSSHPVELRSWEQGKPGAWEQQGNSRSRRGEASGAVGDTSL